MRLKGIHIILCMILFASCKKGTDWTFSLNKNSTEPYGLFLAYDRLQDMYPGAQKSTIYDLNDEMEEQNNKTFFLARNTVLISVTSNLYLNTKEATNIHEYVKNGGQVILLSRYFSKRIDSVFNIESNYRREALLVDEEKDSVNTYEILWDEEEQQFEIDKSFSQSSFDHEEGTPIGNRIQNGKKKVNLVKMDIGQGSIIIGNAPEMITNYGMLKDTNIQYYEKLFSRFDKDTYKLKWFSKHTLHSKRDGGGSTSNLMTLLREKSYLFAFLTLLFMATLFLIFETKRRQRIVEVVPPVTNDSLAFTELVGKLYYSKRGHRNLAHKMIQYYLEHIRSTYNIPTVNLNTEMAHKLARKLNKTNDEMVQFVNYLNSQLTSYELNEPQLKQLYIILKKYS